MDEQKTNDRYRMTITDTATGKVIEDDSFSVIIAGISGDENSAAFSLAAAPLQKVILGIVQTMRAIEKTKDSIKAKGRMSAKSLERAIKLVQFFCDATGRTELESKRDEADDGDVVQVGGDKQ